MNDRILILENGKTFLGTGFGSQKTVVAEMVFNTSMIGYQEIVTDSSNLGKILVMNYPLIGNCGMSDEDYESRNVATSGLVVTEYNHKPSNFRFTRTLGEVMETSDSAGISNLDTRMIVKELRNNGSMVCMITSADANIEMALAEIKGYKVEKRLAEKHLLRPTFHSRTKNPVYNVVALDFGIKNSFIKQLNNAGCNVIVAPLTSTYEDILSHNPDGLLVSSGVDNPSDYPEIAKLLAKLRGKLPIFGIALGASLIAMSYGGKVSPMKVPHSGANHPVKDTITEKVGTYVQNHRFSIDPLSIENTTLKVNKINLMDNDIEGVIDEENMVIGIQFYPDNIINTNKYDTEFDKFLEYMNKMGGNTYAEENRY